MPAREKRDGNQADDPGLANNCIADVFFKRKRLLAPLIEERIMPVHRKPPNWELKLHRQESCLKTVQKASRDAAIATGI